MTFHRGDRVYSFGLREHGTIEQIISEHSRPIMVSLDSDPDDGLWPHNESEIRLSRAEEDK